MKLIPVGFQNDKANEHLPFSVIYERAFSESGFTPQLTMMLNLIRYLENEVDALTHWVCTSHLGLVFYNKDFESYGKGCSEALMLYAGIAEGKPDSYQIQQIGIRTTNNVKIAGEWIRQILQSPKNVYV